MGVFRSSVQDLREALCSIGVLKDSEEEQEPSVPPNIVGKVLGSRSKSAENGDQLLHQVNLYIV